VPVAVFDAYGTLLDVHSAMARHAARLGPEWQRISQDWRLKQLEYTWVRSLAGPAHPLLADLRAAYRALDAYPEVPAMLAVLRAAGWQTAILSNGTPEMLAEGVTAAGLSGLLDAVLSVEAAGVFKPDFRVYRLVTRQFSEPAKAIRFVSSNAWDAFGALEFGFRVAWVNRSGQPDEYGLRGRVDELANLAPLPALLGA
jgi:2-haloacid dehalogenase